MQGSSPFMSDPGWSLLLQECATSTKLFATTFLPSLFTRPFASLTDSIFDAIDDPNKQKVAIAAPRGWGKTTVNTVAYPARNICYGLHDHIMLVSNTADKAIMDAANLKQALVTNDVANGDIIPTVFGDLRTPTWASKQFVAGKTFVIPRGAGQQVRGINYQGNRPSLIIVDDLEDAEGVMSEDRRLKLKQWFFADLMNSVDRSKDNWKIVVIGTILHESSLLADLLKDPSWYTISISLCDDDLKSNWPEYMSDDKVKELYESYRSQGQADTFAREYQNKPISSLDAVFRSDLFKYYEPVDIVNDPNVYFATIVDPAKTIKAQSADSAVITVGIDLSKHRIYFHDCRAGKFLPDQLFNYIFEQVELHGSSILGIEVTSLNEFITQPIKNEMRKRGVFPQFIELKARDKKENRVAQLAPYYRQGYIYHNKNVSHKLELQLCSFPRSELFDVMDAFAYVIELMELDERYFEALDTIDDEFGMLEGTDDKPLTEWRPL